MKKILCAVLCAALALTGCARSPEPSGGKLKIVATLFPTYDFARAIGGDRADVELLLTPGKESHSYEPSTGDVIDIDGCGVFIWTGEYMEPWAPGLLEGLDGAPVVVDASAGIELAEDEHGHGDEQGHELDPHVWTSPVNCLSIVDGIQSAMSSADPRNAAYYAANADRLKAELAALDREFRDITESGSVKKIYHGGRFSMYYFVREYGLDCEAAYDSCSTDAEPSVRRVCDMIDEMRAENAGAVFYEELSNNSVARLIADETGAKPLLLHSCHNLSQEELDRGETYLSLMRKNAENLKEALQ